MAEQLVPPLSILASVTALTFLLTSVLRARAVVNPARWTQCQAPGLNPVALPTTRAHVAS